MGDRRLRAVEPKSRARPSPAAGSRHWSTPLLIGTAVVIAGALVVAVTVAGGGRDRPPTPAASRSVGPAIGGDLHSLVVDPADPGRLFVGGHQAVGQSSDGGRSWQMVESLAGADAMGWAFAGATVWVSGHPGLNRSGDAGRSFVRANQGLPDTDVHAFGASGPLLVGASPAVGVFASEDGGASWAVRSRDAGQGFFGRILVDPADSNHLMAADARTGPVDSADGGRTWKRLGGPTSATWISWAAGDPARPIASGPRGAARSVDGGRTWEALTLPDGAVLVEASPDDANLLYGAGLGGGRAIVWVSRDGARTWARP